MNDIQRSPATSSGPARSSLKLLRAGGSGSPLHCLPGLGGYCVAFMPLTIAMGSRRSIYGLQSQGLDPGEQPHDTVEAMAAFAVDEIRRVQPQGPYFFVGWSLGGFIALEAARQLESLGQRTDLVAMLDTWLSIDGPGAEELDDRPVMEWAAPTVQLRVAELMQLPLAQRWETIAKRAPQVAGEAAAEIGRLAATCVAQLQAVRRYEPEAYRGRAVLFRAGKSQAAWDERWSRLCPHLEVETISGDHYSILRRPDVNVLAERLNAHLDQVQ